MKYKIKIIGEAYPNNIFGLYLNDEYFINKYYENTKNNTEKWLIVEDDILILSATCPDIKKLCAYIYYLSLINIDYYLDKEYDYKTYYDQFKNQLREIWCPKINHDMGRCHCPLYND